MTNQDYNDQNRESWDGISKAYQNEKLISLNDVHYGPAMPGEKELRLLGSVENKKILEIGCGGGQNSIVLAKWGAKVTGLDISVEQLNHARKLADKEGVVVDFIQGRMEDLSSFDNTSIDLVLSSHALGYASSIEEVFSEVSRVLKAGGCFVVCLSHPMWQSIGPALEENDLSRVRSYFDNSRDIWDWDCHDGSKGTFNQTYWTISETINCLIKAGFTITRIEEPRAYDIATMSQTEMADIPYIARLNQNNRDSYVHKFIRVNRLIPFSLIIRANKTTTPQNSIETFDV